MDNFTKPRRAAIGAKLATFATKFFVGLIDFYNSHNCVAQSITIFIPQKNY